MGRFLLHRLLRAATAFAALVEAMRTPGRVPMPRVPDAAVHPLRPMRWDEPWLA